MMCFGDLTLLWTKMRNAIRSGASCSTSPPLGSTFDAETWRDDNIKHIHSETNAKKRLMPMPLAIFVERENSTNQ
jgi:hypothetical protein